MLREIFSVKDTEALISEQTLRCLFRAILEPVIENRNTDLKIMLYIEDKSLFSGIIERLKLSNLDYCFSQAVEGNLSYNYVFISGREFSSLLVWVKEDDKYENKYRYSYNINDETVVNFAKNFARNMFLSEKSDNNIIAETVRKLSEYIETNSVSESVISKNSDEYDIKKVRYISHEIKNQLSICDLYTEIIKKYCDKNGISDGTILKSAECIKRAVKMAGNSLMELKSSDNIELKKYNVKELISDALGLSKVYAINKNIDFYIQAECDRSIPVDRNKFEAVIINLVKNACEAFEDEQEEKKITIKAVEEDDLVSILVSNNAKPIEDCSNIFNEGYTTKTSGSGFGLYICKKNIEELSGKLELVKSDNVSTEFKITMI